MMHVTLTNRTSSIRQNIYCYCWIKTRKEITGRPFSGKSNILSNIQEMLGEEQISSLKQSVISASSKFDEATANVESARISVRKLQGEYEEHQKEHLAILMRRDNWTESDIQRFAEITSNEVRVKRELEEKRKNLQRYEEEQGLRQINYMDAIRVRYHEEQLWQDKWRVISTYGTWALIGLNSLIFVGGQYFHQIREEERMAQMNNLLNEKLVSIGMIGAQSDDPTANNNDKSEESSPSPQTSAVTTDEHIENKKDFDASPFFGADEELHTEVDSGILDNSTTWTRSLMASFERSCKGMVKATMGTVHLPSAAAGATVTLIVFLTFSKR
uniref:Sensitive to high expression protein 9, mitochondrial n=1 Tax=Leptocylindrus danicus TaxID=163516 RepID=A0A7S2LNF2_9STRA|mmetsp:Transcript_7428/g.11080  ORF Transcript_7428/g.11080 Transcript_7428/m.11080 type:complete len:329 (+) Transcript_7428:73-1059(+)